MSDCESLVSFQISSTWRGEETWSGTFESKCSVMSVPRSRVQIDSCSPYENRSHCLLFKVRTEEGLYESAKSMAHLILVLQPFGLVVHEFKMARIQAVIVFLHIVFFFWLLNNADILQVFIQENMEFVRKL